MCWVEVDGAGWRWVYGIIISMFKSSIKESGGQLIFGIQEEIQTLRKSKQQIKKKPQNSYVRHGCGSVLEINSLISYELSLLNALFWGSIATHTMVNEVGQVASLSSKQGRYHKYILSTYTLLLKSNCQQDKLQVINITWSQGCSYVAYTLSRYLFFLKTFENIHIMERCLVWYHIVFPQNSKLLE